MDDRGRLLGGLSYDEALDATLTADGDQTILVIEVRGMPLDAIAFYGVGWQIHAENLAAYLGGRTRGETKERWDDLVPAYRELAASISQRTCAYYTLGGLLRRRSRSPAAGDDSGLGTGHDP